MFLKHLFGRKNGEEQPKAPPSEPEPCGLLLSPFDPAETEALVPAFERQLKAELPEQYRTFLRKYNGGETPNTRFRIGEVASDLRALYGLGAAAPRYHFDQLGKSRILRQGMLLIGENAWGDHIALKLSGEGAGGVYFLYHDRTPRTFLPLTEDFAGFLARCESNPLHVRTLEERRASLRAQGREPTPEIEELWEQEIRRLSGLHPEPVVL